MPAARAAVQTLLDGSAELTALGFTEVIASNSVDSPPQDRFIVIRWEESTGIFDRRATTRCQVWFHDTDRDYGAIEEAMVIVKDILLEVTHFAGSDGVTLTQARWDEDSSDFFDDGYQTVTKWSGFTVLARR